MSDLTKIAAGNVARRRDILRLTLRDVEERCGVSRQSVLNIEKGKGVTLLTLDKVAAVLGCTAADLLAEPRCMNCSDSPPPGFTCNECGAGGAQ